MTRLVFAVPSKGRLMEQAAEALAHAGLVVRKTGSERGYRGEIAGLADVEVAYVSSSEIVQHLRDGQAHIGITGEDLIRENIPDADDKVDFLAPLGFGFADVVVAVPQCWIDIDTMAQLQAMAPQYRRAHGRQLRVATKYLNLTRRFFRRAGLTDYRIVESLGATEGAPASGAADLIVDITTTGSTLKANALKILSDGVMLKSQANLMASRQADWSPPARAARAEIERHLSALRGRG
jgi:ATP phosphoribosyltransferase